MRTLEEFRLTCPVCKNAYPEGEIPAVTLNGSACAACRGRREDLRRKTLVEAGECGCVSSSNAFENDGESYYRRATRHDLPIAMRDDVRRKIYKLGAG